MDSTTHAETTRDLIHLHAEEHPLVEPDPDAPIQERVLHLIHRKAYEEAASLASGASVLDVGCNTGYGTVLLVGRASRVVGVDVSPSAIQRARRDHPGRAEWLLVNGRTLPFDDGSFDLVLSFQVLEHLEDPITYLQEAARVLKPGGAALFTTPNATIRVDPGMRPWNPFHVREYTAPEFASLLASTFHAVEIRGLFALPDLDAVERARVRTARRHARWRRRVASVFGEGVAGIAAASLRALRRLRGTRMEALDNRRHSTSDLFYSEDRLDEALDLMAVCRSPAALRESLFVKRRDRVEK